MTVTESQDLAAASGRCGYGISHPKSDISHLCDMACDMGSRYCDIPCDMDHSEM